MAESKKHHKTSEDGSNKENIPSFLIRMEKLRMQGYYLPFQELVHIIRKHDDRNPFSNHGYIKSDKDKNNTSVSDVDLDLICHETLSSASGNNSSNKTKSTSENISDINVLLDKSVSAEDNEHRIVIANKLKRSTKEDDKENEDPNDDYRIVNRVLFNGSSIKTGLRKSAQEPTKQRNIIVNSIAESDQIWMTKYMKPDRFVRVPSPVMLTDEICRRGTLDKDAAIPAHSLEFKNAIKNRYRNIYSKENASPLRRIDNYKIHNRMDNESGRFRNLTNNVNIAYYGKGINESNNPNCTFKDQPKTQKAFNDLQYNYQFFKEDNFLHSNEPKEFVDSLYVSNPHSDFDNLQNLNDSPLMTLANFELPNKKSPQMETNSVLNLLSPNIQDIDVVIPNNEFESMYSENKNLHVFSNGHDYVQNKSREISTEFNGNQIENCHYKNNNNFSNFQNDTQLDNIYKLDDMNYYKKIIDDNQNVSKSTYNICDNELVTTGYYNAATTDLNKFNNNVFIANENKILRYNPCIDLLNVNQFESIGDIILNKPANSLFEIEHDVSLVLDCGQNGNLESVNYQETVDETLSSPGIENGPSIFPICKRLKRKQKCFDGKPFNEDFSDDTDEDVRKLIIDIDSIIEDGSPGAEQKNEDVDMNISDHSKNDLLDLDNNCIIDNVSKNKQESM